MVERESAGTSRRTDNAGALLGPGLGRYALEEAEPRVGVVLDEAAADEAGCSPLGGAPAITRMRRCRTAAGVSPWPRLSIAIAL